MANLETVKREDPTKTANVDWAISGLLSGLRPPPDLTISEWAQAERILPKTSSSESGGWDNDRTPYLVEIMDCLSPQHPCLS